MRRLLVVLFLAAPLVAGCLTPAATQPLKSSSATAGRAFPPEAAFLVNGSDGKPLPWSFTVEQGPYGGLASKVVKVAMADGVKLSVGIFLPDVPAGTKVPALLDVGPYYGELDDNVGTAAHVRLGKFLIDNFVPHGYAVVQANVRGTGDSDGCNDYMGDTEQADLNKLVTYLGEQDWSNGNVGIIGKSYDGSTPYEAATFGNPHLKTIVPIEGIDSLQQLHFRNGSSETRSLILGELYYTYGATDGGGPPSPSEDPSKTDPTQSARMACTVPLSGPEHAPLGAYGYVTGGGKVIPGPLNDYWKTRDFRDRILKNYKGSIFYVHGFQDWNVKPSQGLDIYNAFPGNKKALIGEWAHDHADRVTEHPDVRMDWAEMLLRWFDHELKGIATDTGPAVIVEDTHGNWRAEPANAFPPTDATWITLHPSADGKLVATGAKGSDVLAGSTAARFAAPAIDMTPAAKTLLTFKSEPFAKETRISGLPQLHVTVTPRASGGQLWAELHEITAAGKDVWIGRAQMNLDYAAGGETFVPVTPGMPLVAKMEFFPLDARILAGSTLKLVLTQDGPAGDPLPRPESAPPIDVNYGDKVTSLNLPTIERPFAVTRWDLPDLDLSKKTGGGAEASFAATS